MKKRVFITGATGTMGWAGLQEFLKRLDRFEITILARPSKVNKKKLEPISDKIRIVWGDLMRYEDVEKATQGADYVLHVGGMVSPAADYFPNKTRRVNVKSAENVVKAVLAQPNADDIKVCYIGTVAQTSDRNEPIHWGRTGDPITISVYDHYAISKTMAERVIVDSGIKKWVSLRQSGILYPSILKNYDPIMFHVPLRGVLEWCTVEDSGRVLANLCEDAVPEEFWNRFYNIGSGPQYRLSNYEFECKLLGAIHCPRPEKIFNPEWFVLRNFHGEWYSDSQVLEDYLHFRGNVPVDEYFKKMGEALPWYFSLASLVPAWIIKLAMRPMAYKKKWGTQDWIKKGEKERIIAYYGSMEAWRNIPDWEHQDLSHPSEEAIILDHGYDETKPISEWTIEDMKAAAAFRGGKCLSETMVKGDFSTLLEWECQFGHKFKASPALVLLGGHWCPECLPTPWNYGEIAKGNPFFAQVWYPIHSKDENDYFGEEIFDGWEQ
jgi:nucleoside-diphosphate-sugar epimerase